MPDGDVYTTYSYRLRSAGLIPIRPGIFLSQTFGANKTQIDTYTASRTLPKTEDFAGADVNAEYVSASFQRLPYLTEGGEQVFSGNINYKPEFIDEDDIPGS